MVSDELVRTLQADTIAARCLAALDAAAIPAALLKGSALADLYADRPRTYLDADVYVDPAREQDVGAVLRADGWRDLLDGAHEIERPVHASTWVHSSLPSSVDLHRTLAGAAAPPEAVWHALSAHFEAFEVAGQPCQRLDRVARALHVVLHAAQSGPADGKACEDLRRGLSHFTAAEWRAAADLAADLAAVPAMAAGLGVLPAGTDLVTDLGLDRIEPGTYQRLWSMSAVSGAKALHELQQRRGPLARIAFALRRVFPSAALLRSTEPWAARTPLLVPVAYGVRLARIAWRAPRALREYRQAAQASARARERRAPSSGS